MDAPTGFCCYICLDDVPPPITPGCACRTSFAHPACMTTQAEHKTEAWHTCGTCKQAFTGPMREILAYEWVEFLLRDPRVHARPLRPPRPSRLIHEARVHLARVHVAAGRYSDAERILVEEMHRSRASVSASVSSSMALGECLKKQGRYADAERIYRRLIDSFDDKACYDALEARSGLAQVLLETNSKEAESIHRGVVETAARVMDPHSIRLLSFTGDLALAILYNQRFEDARSMLEPLVERMCRVLGPVHPDTLTTKGNLALALHSLGRSAEAAGIQSALLAELTDTLGADHPSSVSAKANLADYIARSTGSMRDSVQMALEVLDTNRKVLGPEHPDTLMSALSLAGLMIKLEESACADSSASSATASAEEIIRTTVAIAEKSGLPATGVHRLGASSMLADCMYQQGKTTEAVGVMQGLAAAYREHLGEHNESTVAATKRLEALELTALRPVPVEAQQVQELARCTICLESDPAPLQRGCSCRGDTGLSHVQCMIKLAEHRDTNAAAVPATEMPGLAWFMCLTCKSHLTGAMKQELARAWSQRSRHLPADDLRRVRSDQHLIECTYVAGDYAGAETLARSMLARNRIHLGDTHPITLYTGDILGNSLCCLERHEEAETVQRNVLAATIATNGPRDGVTAWRMCSLANTLGKQRKFDEAVRLAQDAVSILRVDGAAGTVGEPMNDERMFLTAASVLAHLFGDQGDHDGARALCSEVLSMQSRVLGPDHPDTLATKANLAATMSRQGNYEEAKRLEIEVLRTMQRVLGPTHPKTIDAKDNLEYTLRCAQASKELTALAASAASAASTASATSKVSKDSTTSKVSKDSKDTKSTGTRSTKHPK